MSLRLWLCAISVAVALFLLRKVKQRVSQATRERNFRLEQRRRHGIPDSDKRPFKEAAAAVEGTRAATPAKSIKSPQHRVSALSVALPHAPNGDGLRNRHGSPVGRRQELEKVGRQPIMRQLSRTALRALDQEQLGMTNTPGYQSPIHSPLIHIDHSRTPRQSQHQHAGTPRLTPLRQSSSHRIDRRVTSRSGVPSKLGKRGHDGSEEDEVEEREERGKRSRRDVEEQDGHPEPTRRRKRDDVSEEEHEEEPRDRRIVQRRKIAPQNEILSEASLAGDQEDDETAESSQADEQDHTDRGKKRYIDDVDAESTVSFRRRPKRGRTSRSVSGAASTTSGHWAEDQSMSSHGEEQEEEEASEEEYTLRTRRGGYSRRPQRQSIRTPRRPPRKMLKQETLEPKRKTGDEWVDGNGMRWKLGDDGVTRKAVVVKETRKKYNMPQDSNHPDRHITHKVLVEKWLTDEEIAEAQKNKQLGWQESDAEGEPKVAAAQVPTPTEALRMNRSLYHLPGTASPIRSSLSHSSFLRNVTPGRNLLSRAGSPASPIGSPRLGSPALRGSSSMSRLRGREMTEAEDRERAKALARTLQEQVAIKEGRELPKEVAMPTQESKPVAFPAAQVTPSLSARSNVASAGEAKTAPVFSFGQPPTTLTSDASKDVTKAALATSSLSPAPGSRPFADNAAPLPSFSSAATSLVTDSKATETAIPKPVPFSFGATSAPSSTSNINSAASAAPAPFSFGTGVTAGSSSKPAAPFAFGSSTATGNATKVTMPASSPAIASFAFGAQKTNPAAPTAQAASSNPFGSAPSSAPIFGTITPGTSGSTTTAPGFTAITPKTAAPTAPSFNFGSSGPIPLGNSGVRGSPAPASNMSNFGAPMPATSNNPFGQSSSPAPMTPVMSAPNTASGATVGQTAPPGGQQGLAFSFGASGPVGSVNGATTPGGRPIRGNRRTKAPGQSMSPAPSPAPTAPGSGFSFSMGK